MTVTFVAEVSSNHNQNPDRCLTFIDQAADIGCAAVKFQLFKIEELFAPEVLQTSARHRLRKQWELPAALIPRLAARCRQRGIKFSCTPFYLQAVDELLGHVDFYKIASYELLWDDLIIKCAKTGKPVVLSTGMATMAEIERADKIFQQAGGRDLTLLHCVSGYPVPVEECNLAAIRTLRRFGHKTGWSDHSTSAAVIYRAVHKFGAEMVEFHLDLDGRGVEYETGHCWLPKEMEKVIKTINAGISADGSGEKLPSPSEQPDRDWRTEPRDGLRPMLETRSRLKK